MGIELENHHFVTPEEVTNPGKKYHKMKPVDQSMMENFTMDELRCYHLNPMINLNITKVGQSDITCYLI